PDKAEKRRMTAGLVRWLHPAEGLADCVPEVLLDPRSVRRASRVMPCPDRRASTAATSTTRSTTRPPRGLGPTCTSAAEQAPANWAPFLGTSPQRESSRPASGWGGDHIIPLPVRHEPLDRPGRTREHHSTSHTGHGRRARGDAPCGTRTRRASKGW